jgi:RecG-like helicase
MMKQWKKILVSLLIIAVGAAGFGFYLYTKKPADVRTLAANYQLTAEALLADYNKDETVANLKYLDKVIAVKGKVTEIKLEPTTGQATVILDTGNPMAAVTCSFYNDEAANVNKLSQGTAVCIKGKCTGKLMDVVLNKCSIEN